MKEQFFNIFKSTFPERKLKFNNKLSAIIVCFFIAAIFWFLIALSRDFSAVFSFPIVYNNLPGQKVVVNDLPSNIIVNVKTTGFRILSYNFRKEKTPVQVDVDARIGKSFDQSADV